MHATQKQSTTWLISVAFYLILVRLNTWLHSFRQNFVFIFKSPPRCHHHFDLSWSFFSNRIFFISFEWFYLVDLLPLTFNRLPSHHNYGNVIDISGFSLNENSCHWIADQKGLEANPKIVDRIFTNWIKCLKWHFGSHESIPTCKLCFLLHSSTLNVGITFFE